MERLIAGAVRGCRAMEYLAVMLLVLAAGISRVWSRRGSKSAVVKEQKLEEGTKEKEVGIGALDMLRERTREEAQGSQGF